MADITGNEKAEILTSSEFIAAPCTDPDCLATFLSVGIPNIRFNDDSKGLLVRAFSLTGTS